jgi:hypothetical protein
MLHQVNVRTDVPPSSPIRRLVEPAFLTPRSESSRATSVTDAEFVASSPAPQKGHSIKKEAFSPNYFKRFFTEEKELGRGGKGVVLLVKHELDGVSLGMAVLFGVRVAITDGEQGNLLVRECLLEMIMPG